MRITCATKATSWPRIWVCTRPRWKPSTLPACWTKQILTDAFRVQLEGRGFSLVEILTMCPTDWFVEPAEAPDWIERNFAGTYPLKVLRTPF